MESFDDIIKSKLEQIQADAAEGTWAHIEKGLSSVNTGTSFKVPFISGVAASVVIGAALVVLPPIGSETQITQVEEDRSIELPKETSNDMDLVPVFEDVEVQVEHAITLNKKSAVIIAEEVPAEQRDDISNANSAKDFESKSAAQESTIASTAEIDFVATGIQCANSEIEFKSTTSKDASITWLFDGLKVAEGTSVTNAFDEAGFHSVRMVATFNDGSQQALSSELEIHQMPNASFLDEVDSETYCLKNTLSLNALGDNLAYKWIVNGDTVKDGKEVAINIDNGLHTIALHTVNEAGCTTIEKRPISVSNTFRLNIPNAFSPSNSDGLNDHWTIPELANMQSFKLTVKRISTGNIVFETTEQVEWDGTISGSTEMPKRDEMFTYTLLVIDQCGEVIQKTGTIRYL